MCTSNTNLPPLFMVLRVQFVMLGREKLGQSEGELTLGRVNDGFSYECVLHYKTEGCARWKMQGSLYLIEQPTQCGFTLNFARNLKINLLRNSTEIWLSLIEIKLSKSTLLTWQRRSYNGLDVLARPFPPLAKSSSSSLQWIPRVRFTYIEFMYGPTFGF